MGIAVATLIVQSLIATALGYVVFRRLLHTSPRSTVVAVLPGLTAAATATAGAVTYRRVDPLLNRFFDLAACGTAATLVAGIVLVALDRPARALAYRLLTRTRRRPLPVES